MKKNTLKFAFLLALLLAVVYVPRMKQEGGILFNVIQDITGIYGFPAWDTFTDREIRAGFFPLWNPHNALGEPHLANMQSAIFYLLTWLKVLTHVDFFVYDLLLVLRLLLAGLFMWCFLGEFKLDFLSRAFGAASFALTGYFVRHVYMSHLNVEILIPLAMRVFGKLARHKTRRWFMLTVFVVWLIIVGGFPEAALYLLALCSLWYLYHCGRTWVRGIPILFGTLLLGALAASPQSLPFIEYLHNSWTYHESGIGYGHLDYRYFWSLIIPWYFGENNVSVLDPFLAPYIGTAVFFLAIAGALGQDRRKVIFFTLIAIALFGVIYGITPFIWIGDIYPFSVTLNFKYAVPSFVFCVSALAAFGMKELLEGIFSKPIRRSLWAASVMFLLAVFVYHKAGGRVWYPLNPFWILVAGGIIAFLVLTAAAPIGKPKKAGAALLLLSLIAPTYGAKGIVNKDFLTAPDNPFGRFIAQNHPTARFGSDTVLPPNTNLSLMLNDIRYYNPMYVKRYAEIFARAESGGEYLPSCLSCAIASNFRDHAFLQPSTDKLNDPLWEKMGLSVWIGSAPGRVSILRSLVIEGDWFTAHHGMIARTKFDDYLPVMFAHAPSKIAFLPQLLGDAERLVFIPAIDKKAMGKSDGVFFQIKIRDESPKGKTHKEKVLYSRFLTPQEDARKEVTIDMPDEWKNEETKLIFITAPGPMGNAESDWSGWGMPALEFENTGKWQQAAEGVFVRDVPFGYLEKGNNMERKVTVKLLSSQKISAKCNDCGAGRIVVPYVYYPGWRAYHGKEEMKIIPAEGALMSVEAADEIDFIYKPLSFKIGLWCLIVSFLTVLSSISPLGKKL